MFGRKQRAAAPAPAVPAPPAAPSGPPPVTAPSAVPPPPPPAPADVPAGTKASAAAMPTSRALAEALAAHHWDAATHALRSAPSWGDADRAVAAAVETHKSDGVLDRWFAERPHDTMAAATMGAVLVMRAWEVRSSRRTEHVSDDQFARFHEILREAEATFERSWRADRGNALAWTWMLSSGMGLSIPLSEMRLRFDQVRRVDPWMFNAHATFLQASCRKWRGDHETMFAFARSVSAEAPPGSPLHVLVAIAHLEFAIDSEGSTQRIMAEHAPEIREAGLRSVQHPEFARWASAFDGLRACDWFAFAYDMIDDLSLAAQQRALMADVVTDDPWHYYGDPLDVYRSRVYRLR